MQTDISIDAAQKEFLLIRTEGKAGDLGANGYRGQWTANHLAHADVVRADLRQDIALPADLLLQGDDLIVHRTQEIHVQRIVFRPTIREEIQLSPGSTTAIHDQCARMEEHPCLARFNKVGAYPFNLNTWMLARSWSRIVGLHGNTSFCEDLVQITNISQLPFTFKWRGSFRSGVPGISAWKIFGSMLATFSGPFGRLLGFCRCTTVTWLVLYARTMCVRVKNASITPKAEFSHDKIASVESALNKCSLNNSYVLNENSF